MLPITQSTKDNNTNNSLSHLNRGLKLYNSKTDDLAVKAYLIQDYYLDSSRNIRKCLKCTQALSDYVDEVQVE